VAERPAGGEETKEGKERGKRMLTWGPQLWREEGEGRTWAGLAVRERGERERGWSSGWEGAGPRAWPTREGKEGERGVSSGWAVEEKERGGRSAGPGQGEGLGCLIPSPFLFFFYTLAIQTNLVEFK
jgi:hypothetical protein